MALTMAPPLSPPLSVKSEKTGHKLRMWERFSLPKWLGREEQTPCQDDEKKDLPILQRPGIARRLSRKVVPGLPRPPTFRRQNSEKRERLKPVEPTITERRAASVGRRRALSAQPASTSTCSIPKSTAVSVTERDDPRSHPIRRDTCPDLNLHLQLLEQPQQLPPVMPPPPPPPAPPEMRDNEQPTTEASFDDQIDDEVKDELERKWILNLSMHFRDHSPREKFFLTFAETPQKWRRVTVSCDYRDAPIDSLERDIQSLQFQRDKSARIYESLRPSLAEIQFYQTVTNLKLETRDERLHVHVTEDVNEIIPYPSTQALQYLECRRVQESDLCFEAHMSGFVYKVSVGGEIFIKKEIPGPDSVDEFLYEINALANLSGSNNVVRFQGLVIDEHNTVVKGLLISFAEQGALVDLLYDHKEEKERLSWLRRQRWAKQIVQGLADIHEAGFVQGDFTLSNIVINENDEARIIDINRRGCPVGWEPPEISRLVERSQRISMYIGVKSDLFQLGMVLWALAQGEDEPERQERPLSIRHMSPEIPQYYRDLVAILLDDQPRNRIAAKDLLPTFPELGNGDLRPISERQAARILSSSHKVYIDRSLPNTDDYDADQDSVDFEDATPNERMYLHQKGSIDLPFDGPGSCVVTRRGRTPPVNFSHLSPPDRPSADEEESEEAQIIPVSPTGEHRWEEVEMDGTPYLVQRDSVELKDFQRTGRLPEAKHRSVPLTNTEIGRQLQHTDSGLADADELSEWKHQKISHIDSGLADMYLTGVGGHETLLKTHELHNDDRCDLATTPRGETDDATVELDDRNTNHGIEVPVMLDDLL